MSRYLDLALSLMAAGAALAGGAYWASVVAS